jgi:predicted RNA methylase
MTTTSAAAAALAASRSSASDAPARATDLIHAARLLLPALERGQPIDAAVLRAAMEHAVGASDSEGRWDWKSAYDACEAAAVLFLRKFGGAMAARAGSAAALLAMLARMAPLLPSHTRRSVEGDELQQFSTPVPLALVAGTAAAIVPSDHVLEPSAGTGLLTIFAELAGASLVLNELAETRAGPLGHLFPDVAVRRFDAARIDDHLGPGVAPTVVLMNPPFSALAHVDRRRTDAVKRSSVIGSAPREARPRPCAAFWRSKIRERQRPAPKGEARRAGAQRRTASTAFLSREEWRHPKRRSRAGVAPGEESRAQPLRASGASGTIAILKAGRGRP